MHSEIYTTHLRAQSSILNGEKTEYHLKSKYAKLIKQFPGKKKSSSWSKTKFKQRRVKSKSSKSKLKIEKKENPKSNKIFECQKNIIVEQEKECLNDIKGSNNKNFCPININDINNIYMTESTDFQKKYLNLNLNLPKDNNENEEFFYKTFQNDNFCNYIKKNKDFNDINSFKNYFDIYKLRKHASSVRVKIRNNYFKNNSTFNTRKSSTYFKAIKLKEEILNSNKTINFPDTYTFTSVSTNRLTNDEKNILNEINKLNNTINNKENNVNDNEDINKNIYINTYNYHDVENINYHFFDKSIKMPKKIKKYANHSNPKMLYTDINLSTNIFNSHLYKNKNNKNSFRKKANNTIDNYNQTVNNNIINLNYANSEIFTNKKGKEFLNYNNIDYMNLISPENLKLNSLIKKIPSNRKFKDKSFDLINYIFKLQKLNIKNNSLYNISEYNNRFKSIYPVNECNPFLRIKKSFK